MKSILKIASAVVLPLALLNSCKKDETKAVLTPGGAMNLMASTTTLVLVQANANQPAVTFNWNKASFGYDAATNYTLQMCKAGTNFPSSSLTSETSMGILLTKAFTVGEFNAKMQDIIPNGSPESVEVRVKASVGSNVDPIYSNVVTMTVTSYRDIVNYEFPQALRVAGNYQGWSPGTAPKIVDKQASGTTGSSYEGFINLTDANPQFKLVKGPDWPFGDFGSPSPGILSNGGNNLFVTGGAGVYRIRANTNAMTWAYVKITTFGIIGDATPGGWGASTAMTFNPTDGSWAITTNLTAGELKFRANNDWAINFGDNSPRDNKPDYDGSNIPIPLAGNYTITLDIGLAGNYAYTVRKN